MGVTSKKVAGEARPLSGAGAEPVNLAGAPAPASPAPGLAGEKGGEVETESFEEASEVVEARLKSQPAVFEVKYADGATSFRVWEYWSFDARVILRSAPPRAILTAVLPPTLSPNVRAALKCFRDAAASCDPFLSASAATAGLAFLYGASSPTNVQITIVRDSFVVEVRVG